MTAAITQIHRHPVKGLNAEPLARATLTPGEGLPHDRSFALAHGADRLRLPGARVAAQDQLPDADA